MADASTRGWGHPGRPGSAAGRAYASSFVVTVTAGGISVQVHRVIAPLVVGFINECVARGYKFNGVKDDWGFAHRYIRGLEAEKILSNHSWAIALDLNATKNPMTEDGVVHTDMPFWMPDVAAKYGFFWGGHYTGKRKDPMHYEILLTPQQVTALAKMLAEQWFVQNEAIKEEDDMKVRIMQVAGVKQQYAVKADLSGKWPVPSPAVLTDWKTLWAESGVTLMDGGKPRLVAAADLEAIPTL